MKRRLLMHHLLDGKTGDMYYRRTVVERCKGDCYERQVRKRDNLRAVTASFIALVLVIGFIRGLWFLVTGR